MTIAKMQNDFSYHATFIWYRVKNFHSNLLKRISGYEYKAVYGLTILQTAITWNMLEAKILHLKQYMKKHLLWALHFREHYQNKRFLAHDLNAAPHTVSKWV